MEYMEERSFSELLTELISLAEQVASLAKDSEFEKDVFTEFSILVDKFIPFFNDLRDNITIMDKPSIHKAMESLEKELRHAISLIKSHSLKQPIKQNENITHDLGRSFGLVLLASLEVSTDFREKIGALQKDLMNTRFSGNVTPTSSQGSDFGSDLKVESEIKEERVSDLQVELEIKEERVNVDIDDVVLQLKYGNDEEFTLALLRLKDSIRVEKDDNGWVNDEGVLAVLFNRLSLNQPNNRLNIIQLLTTLASENAEQKEKMADVGFLSALVKSLTRDVDERREVVRLLLDLSDLPAVRRRIGRIQGCIVMLLSILNGDDPVASDSAAKLLNALSSNTQNALHMAEAGYFKPLVQYLKEGSDMTKILMATALSRLELTDQCRASLGEDGAIEPLVKMFNSGKLESKLSALNALQKLSSCTENVQCLISSGIVVSLLQLLFSVTSVLMTLREPASVILARIAKSETILVNQDVAQHMLSLLNLSSPIIKCHLLEALNSIAAHPSATKVRRKMKEKGALQLLLPFLMETNIKIRSNALQLLCTLSGDLTEELMEHLGETHLCNIVKILSSTTSESEKAAAVGILSNLPTSDKKVTDILKQESLLPILISIMNSSTGSTEPATCRFTESAAGVLIRFTDSSDKKLQLLSAEHGVIPLLVKLLSTGPPVAKCRAATSLAQLSQSSLYLRKSKKSRWFCVPPSADAYCEVHDGYCFVDCTFCLVKAGAIPPLIQILEGNEREADEAALRALATLLQDDIWENGSNCIAQMLGVPAIIKVLEVGNENAQRKALWILERIFGVEEHKVQYGESAQGVLIALAQQSDSRLKSTSARLLAQLELLQDQSSYF
ncbi:RING-type E3 ubiquitin transferase [Quillaja saponaria]|uniref:RING-type E3 ubiquitin transferase n=1 Tax=Quillaja saponaria TaxID=32244 RepID=A0AAD7QIY9_QUISA|nr:RING-type E3 ubiquitin transferase [Quillaja saponaria]